MFPLEELLQQSDIVSLHVPSNGETKGLLSRQRLAMMKPSAILINVARAPSWTTWLWPRR